MSLKLGITLSQPHLEYLNIPLNIALDEIFSCNFSHIRLGTYWHQLEPHPKDYHFENLISLLKNFEKHKQAVILTVGVKAPRWPEFYWPNFIQKRNTNDPTTQKLLLEFVKRTIKETQSFKCITHWQVENEPLDPSGPDNIAISENFLKQEVQLVKQLDSRPIIVNLWGNDLSARGFFTSALELADEIGIDLYYKQFIKQILGKSIYKGPRQSDRDLSQLLSNSHKPIWITELQAEPWEKNEKNYLSQNPASINPQQLKKNIERAGRLPTKEILLWGFEYWLWRKQQGDNRYLKIIKDLKTI